MSDPLAIVRAREPRLVLGLNAGTSLDGVDVAAVRIAGSGTTLRHEILAYENGAIPDRLRRRLRDIERAEVAEICELDREVGELLASRAEALLAARGLRPDLVGSHGITAWHRPPRRPGENGATLQIGDLSVLVERLGCPVVGDFRTADVAAGGQGAPLVPYLDWLLFRDRPGTLALNLGGMSNLTWVGSEIEETIAFDAGPANVPLDALVRRATRGQSRYDRGGELAAKGRVDQILLDQLMRERFIQSPPPKTTGREEFGEAWTARLLQRQRRLGFVDLLATVTAFVAEAVAHSVRSWIAPRPLVRVVVSGGGVHNRTLMRQLERRLAPVPVLSWEGLGGDPDAKEALLFAVLANERIFGHPGNVPSATGARWPVGLGKVCW